MENETKNKKIFWLVALVIILLASGVYFIFMLKNINKNERSTAAAGNYVVPNVPYFGMYDHKGSFSFVCGYTGGDFCISALEILEYWNPGQNNIRAVCDRLKEGISSQENVSLVAPYNLVQMFEEKGFSAQMMKLSLTDLKKYVNSEAKTPLMLFLPISNDQPDSISYYPATVLIGVDEKAQKLTLHSYWLGNNYELSFDEFNQLENKLQPDQRDAYVVVQPKNLDEKLKEISERKIAAYPARTSIMQNGEEMFKNYAIGSGGAYNSGLWPQVLEYLSKTENDSNFNEFFPPYFKTMLYYQKAKMYFLKNDLDNALVYAQKAVVINQDLDQSFKDWPGYEISYNSPDKRGIAPEPYMILGDVLDKKGDLKGALNAYKEASRLTIVSNKIDASIKNVELEMARKGIE
ncbi:MAG: hypothetical protein WC022_01825 [Parcubacteria group bacterium]